MPKTETVFARFSLASYDDHFKLEEHRSEINQRLYDVMTDNFYLQKLTALVEQFQPEDIAPWLARKKDYKAPNFEEIRAIAKFQVTDQKVDLVEIRFH